jgi:hypothetical protein
MRTIRNATFTLTANQSNVISESKTIGRRLVFEVTNQEVAGGTTAFISVDEEAKAATGRTCQAQVSKGWSTDAGYSCPQGQINIYATAAIVISIYEEIET